MGFQLLIFPSHDLGSVCVQMGRRSSSSSRTVLEKMQADYDVEGNDVKDIFLLV